MTEKSAIHCESVPYNYVFEVPDFPLNVMPIFSAEDIDLHSHERFYEIVLIVSGSAVHCYENTSYKLFPGSVFVIPPGCRHSYSQCRDLDYYNVHINFRDLKLPLWDLADMPGYQELFLLQPELAQDSPDEFRPKQLDIPTLDRAADMLKNMYETQSSLTPGCRFALLTAFMEFMQLICYAPINPENLRPAEDQSGANIPIRAAQIAAVLTKKCEHPWTVSSICRRFNLSQGSLYRIFHDYYHTSPMLFLTRQRIRKALSLLSNSGMPLESVARQCGFANGSYFSTVFRREFGISPLQYRKNPDPAYPAQLGNFKNVLSAITEDDCIQ